MLTVITFQVVPAIAITMPLSATVQIFGNTPGMTSEIAKIMYERIIAEVAPSFLLTRCPIKPPTIEPTEIAASKIPNPRAPRPSSSRANLTNTA